MLTEAIRIDYVINSKDKKAIAQLKDVFGLGALQDIRDFAVAIAVRFILFFFVCLSPWPYSVIPRIVPHR